MDLSKEDTGNAWQRLDTFVARTHKRTDGLMGDFVKYYNGSFCEAGNFGKETPIMRNAWHARVAYSKLLGKYVACASPINRGTYKNLVQDICEWRVSDDMIHWSEPAKVEYEGGLFGNHYMAIASNDADGLPQVINGERFVFLTNHNGTDVTRFDARVVKE